MKVSIVLVVVCASLLGCSHHDPIDRVVAAESRNPYFANGLAPIIPLPASATCTQVLSRLPDIRNHGGTNFTVLEVRHVRISDAEQPSRLNSDYTAVLVDTTSGRKVVLLQYQGYGARDNWWGRVYDVR